MSVSSLSPLSTFSTASKDASPLGSLTLRVQDEEVNKPEEYQPLCAQTKLSSVMTEVSRIRRVFELYQAVGVQRTAWKRMIQGVLDVAQAGYLAMDEKIKELPPKIRALYSFKDCSVDSRIARLREDLLLTPTYCPIRKPSEGVKADTFISDYSCGEDKPSDVIKLTTEHEAICNELYSALFRGFAPGRVDATGRIISYGVFVPRASNLDLAANKYQGKDADSKMVSEIQQMLEEIARATKPKEEECKRCDDDLDNPSVGQRKIEAILFQEKVPGQNFAEFVDTQYTKTGDDNQPQPRLSKAETERMYELIGRLHEFDQWLGNDDRVGNPDLDPDTGLYAPNCTTANPGNIMIQSQGGFRLWAIDNELSEALIAPGPANHRYIEYLKSSHSSVKAIELRVKEVILSLHAAVKEKIRNTPQSQVNLAAFESDLGIGVSRALENKIKQGLKFCTQEQYSSLKDLLADSKRPFADIAKELIAIVDKAREARPKSSGSTNLGEAEKNEILSLLEERRTHEFQQGIAYNAIRKGMLKAIGALKDTLIPAWTGSYMDSFRQSLLHRYSKQLCSDLFAAQSARFKAFQSINFKPEDFQ